MTVSTAVAALAGVKGVKASSQFVPRLAESMEWVPDDDGGDPSTSHPSGSPTDDPDPPESLVGWRVVKIGEMDISDLDDLKRELARAKDEGLARVDVTFQKTAPDFADIWATAAVAERREHEKKLLGAGWQRGASLSPSNSGVFERSRLSRETHSPYETLKGDEASKLRLSHPCAAQLGRRRRVPKGLPTVSTATGVVRPFLTTRLDETDRSRGLDER